MALVRTEIIVILIEAGVTVAAAATEALVAVAAVAVSHTTQGVTVAGMTLTHPHRSHHSNPITVATAVMKMCKTRTISLPHVILPLLLKTTDKVTAVMTKVRLNLSFKRLNPVLDHPSVTSFLRAQGICTSDCMCEAIRFTFTPRSLACGILLGTIRESYS
jgi:hypothetical protein